MTAITITGVAIAFACCVGVAMAALGVVGTTLNEQAKKWSHKANSFFDILSTLGIVLMALAAVALPVWTVVSIIVALIIDHNI